MRWCLDGEFLAIFLHPVFPASRVQHVSDLHFKFALRPRHVWKYGITSNLRRLRLGEEKEVETTYIGQKYNVRICYACRAAIIISRGIKRYSDMQDSLSVQKDKQYELKVS